MSSSAHLLAVPSGDEPLEFTKTAPLLDPKIPFFKYLDMLATISKDALTLRHQAYEIFLALNPHLSYASVTITNEDSIHPIKLNKKAEILLKSSMILIQRYCLILQVSLPKLPSFRRRTHSNTLKAYEVKAVGYRDDLTEYQDEGALVHLQACFLRSKASAQRDMTKPESLQHTTTIALPADRECVAEATTTTKSASAKSTEQVPEPSNNPSVAPPVVVEENPSRVWAMDQTSAPDVVASANLTSSALADAPIRRSRSVVIKDKLCEAKEQASVPDVLTETGSASFTPVDAPSRRTSRRKRQSAEAQVNVDVSYSTTDTATEAEVDPLGSTPLTESALRRWEKEIRRLREVSVMMEEQIGQSSRTHPNNNPKSTAPEVPSFTPSTPSRLTPAAVSRSFNSAPDISPANTAAVEPIKRDKTTTVAPTVILTVPTPPAISPSTLPNPLVTRAIFTPAPPRETKSTTKRMSPSTGAIRGSGVVRNLIRQYETPSSSSSTSSKGDRPDIVVNRKNTSTGAEKAAGASVVVSTKTSSKIGRAASTTSTTIDIKPKATEMVAPAPNPFWCPRKGASPNLGDKQNPPAHILSSTAKTSPVKTCPVQEPASSGSHSMSKARSAIAKTALVSDTLHNSPVSQLWDQSYNTISGETSSTPHSFARNNNSNCRPSTTTSTQTARTKDGKRASHSYADGSTKAPTLSAPSHSRFDPLISSSLSSRLVDRGLSAQGIATVSTNCSFAIRSRSKASIAEQASLEASVQGSQSQPRPSLSASSHWNNPPPLLSQLRTISSSSVNTISSSSSVATVFRDRAKIKPVVALGSSIFAPLNAPLENSPAAAVTEVNLSNQSSPKSICSKALSSDESIRSWRLSIPPIVTAVQRSHCHDSIAKQSQQANSTKPLVHEDVAFDWKSEVDGDGDDENDDGESHVDLIRIPTMSSVRSSTTISTSRTLSFSALSPLGSGRFKTHQRAKLSNVLVQETKTEEDTNVEIQDTKETREVRREGKKKSSHVPESDESDPEAANLQYLEVPPARGTLAWLDMRAQEQKQEEKQRLLIENEGAYGSGYDTEDSTETTPLVRARYCGKYSTLNVTGSGMHTQQPAGKLSRLYVRQIHFEEQLSSPVREQSQVFQSMQGDEKQELDETSSFFPRGRIPSFTQPFKPEHQHTENHTHFSSSSGIRQNNPRSLRHYAPTISSSSTCTVHQPAPSHSVSPASSAFKTLRATPSISSTRTHSVKSFTTGSTTTLKTPKFYPSSTGITSTASASNRSSFPSPDQTDDGVVTAATSILTNMRRIHAREATLLGSMSEPVLGSQSRQMNVQAAAATLVRNGSSPSHAACYAQQQQQLQQRQQQQQQNQQERGLQQRYQHYRNY
ncbi:hypothetical protein BGZ95_002437 [Linnemannia exigua]|uniref:Uncharacterized protein n=1 Tax=Linnemannia exigua TaxID=604196 RepID=A0AAD4D7M2_9FUNG|nr:hypothetical protein BGZ95_002437 [Linnemannia exigua]